MMYCEADPDGPAADNIKIRLVAAGYDQTVDAVDAVGAAWQQGTFSDVDDELDCLTNGEIIVTFTLVVVPCCDDGMGGDAQCICTFPGPSGGCGANPGIDW